MDMPPEMNDDGDALPVLIGPDGEIAIAETAIRHPVLAAIGEALLHAWPLKLGDGPFTTADGQAAVIIASMYQERIELLETRC